ncbi:MAG: hypothetical protein O7A64_05290, partial [Alphaproteobacteria bacterium]|nr:hypothetical protein [Alphaproteobacteria bacterium]
VGKLAGLPGNVVARAEQVLQTLEKSEHSSGVTRLADDLPLFAAVADGSPLEDALSEIRPDELSPREALEALYRLKRIEDESDGESG